jgi:transcriptional regulator with XRE-family HTH domain
MEHHIGIRMKALRKNAGLSVAEAAQAAKIPVSTYREWENGRQIKGEPYVRIANALNANLQELMTGEKPNSSDLIRKIAEIEEICLHLRKTLSSLLDET